MRLISNSTLKSGANQIKSNQIKSNQIKTKQNKTKQKNKIIVL
jgi:hypothetical protein